MYSQEADKKEGDDMQQTLLVLLEPVYMMSTIMAPRIPDKYPTKNVDRLS